MNLYYHCVIDVIGRDFETGISHYKELCYNIVSVWHEWMIDVLGHDSALLWLYWAGDNLGE